MRFARPKTFFAIALAGLSAIAVSACGTQEITVASSTPAHSAAVLFQDRCAGCHTLAVAGANGSAANPRSGMRNNGPNFNVRKESYERVIYAIQNGGFSGAVMPQNIVSGAEAKLLAAFVAKYAGADVNTPPSPGAMGSGSSAAAAPPKQDLAALGAQVFAQNGCAACHVLKAANAAGKIGPTLEGVGADTAAALNTAIVNPNAEIIPGYQKGIMPANFGQLLTAEQLTALIAYLQKVAR